MYNRIMKDKFIHSVAEFMEWVAKVGKRGMLYRGLADSDWEVSASIHGRLQENGIKNAPYNIFREMTKLLLTRARAEGHDIENHRQLPDLELLAKLQHHKSATCLIDFTSNPLVALWFACQAPMGKSGRVIAFDSGDTDLCSEIPAQDLDKPIDTWLPVNTPDERLWVLPPKKTNNRIVAQQSVFVFGEGVIAQEKLANKENCLVKDKSAVLEELATQGITAESLFCDFAGFALQNARDAEYRNWATDNAFISGLASQEAGDNESAIKFYDKAIKASSQFAVAYYNRGLAKGKLGDLLGAIADYDRAIGINPQYVDAYNNRGFIKDESGDLPGAIADFDRALEVNPQHAVAYLNRGVAKKKSGDIPGAIADFDRALSINPQYAEAYLNCGVIKTESGDHKGAIADFDKALEINPQYTFAYNNRGNAKDESGDHKGAIADYNRALEINPQYANAYYNRAITKEKSGDTKGAAADMLRSRELEKASKSKKK